jgi:hypothetical protein
LTFAAVSAIVVGLGMIAQWSISLARGQVPELDTEPIRIRFHLAAELVTALALIGSGIGMLAGCALCRQFYLIAAGMLIYTVIVSPGYFAQQGNWALPAMFAAILVLALVSLLYVV